MSEELGRVAAGLPVAVLVPLAIPGIQQAWAARTALCLALAALVLAPLFPGWESWVLLVFVTIASVLAGPRSRGWPDIRQPGRRSFAGAAIAVAAAAVVAPAATWSAVEDVVLSRDVSLVLSGALAAVIVTGPVVGAVLTPFTRALSHADALATLNNAGTYIGWFERAVFFTFVLGGEPQAAAVALAAKSFARFPALNARQEGFAEYFLIGTLASLAAATGIAIATRAALGLPVL